MSTSLYAKSEGHIVSASASNSSVIVYDSTNKGDYKAQFGLTTSYDHAFAHGFQFGGDFQTSFYSGGHSFTLVAGPGYNFTPNDIENSYFASIKFGVTSTKFDSETETNAVAVLTGAKRFKLMEHVSYVPGVRIQKIFGTDTPDPMFSFDLLKISIIF
jgi:hypothetical protein